MAGHGLRVLQAGYPCGYLLASLLYWIAFSAVGWRALFMIGAIPGLFVAGYIFFYVQELPDWLRRKTHAKIGTWEAISSNWQLMIYAILIMTAINFYAHGTQDLYPSAFLRVQHGFSVSTVSLSQSSIRSARSSDHLGGSVDLLRLIVLLAARGRDELGSSARPRHGALVLDVADTTGTQISTGALKSPIEVLATNAWPWSRPGRRTPRWRPPCTGRAGRCTTSDRCRTSRWVVRARPGPTARATGWATSPPRSSASSWCVPTESW